MKLSRNIAVVAAMIVLLAIGVGIGYGVGTTAPSPSGSGTTSTSSATQNAGGASNSSSPFVLTLVEIMQNMWNSSAGMQPKYFVLGSHGLESSANISLPANRLIQLTIVSYDTPEPAATNAEGVVSGTVGGNVYVINGTVAAGTANVSMAMAADWGQNVTAVPASELAHTFTIQQLGINIPVVAGSTIIAYVDIHQKGSFTWVCLTPCGLGDNGLTGAMDTPGWMMGSVVAS